MSWDSCRWNGSQAVLHGHLCRVPIKHADAKSPLSLTDFDNISRELSCMPLRILMSRDCAICADGNAPTDEKQGTADISSSITP